ncbi:MAG: hypothetical protein MJ252_20540 [archaeon]|nr:hypothetical protein [archaeon]
MGNEIKVEPREIERLIGFPEEIQMNYYLDSLGLREFIFSDFLAEVKLRTLLTNDIVDLKKLNYIIQKMYTFDKLTHFEKKLFRQKEERKNQKKKERDEEILEWKKSLTITPGIKQKVVKVGPGIEAEEEHEEDLSSKQTIGFGDLRDLIGRFKTSNSLQEETKKEEEKTEEERKPLINVDEILHKFDDGKSKKKEDEEEEEKETEEEREFKRKSELGLINIRKKKGQTETACDLFEYLQGLSSVPKLPKSQETLVTKPLLVRNIEMILFLLCSPSILNSNDPESTYDKIYFVYTKLRQLERKISPQIKEDEEEDDYSKGFSKEVFTNFCERCFTFSIMVILQHMIQFITKSGKRINKHLQKIVNEYEENKDNYVNGFVCEYLLNESELTSEKLVELFEKDQKFLSFECILTYIIKKENGSQVEGSE